ncbi:hypothetical protein ACE6H2_017255 [Prunus campanulata]
MLNYSSFYSNFGVEDSLEDDAVTPPGEVEHAAFLLYWLCKFFFCTQANKVTVEFAHVADYLAQGGRLALGPYLLGQLYRTVHDIVTDGMKPKHGGPLWAFQFWLQAYFPEARPFPLFLSHDLSVVPDVETENDLKEIWGSFLVSRDLHCGMSKAGDEVYLPNFVVRQFGLIQTAPLPPLSINRLSSWRADVSQLHGVAKITFQLQQGMTFLNLMPWRRRNAYDEDGRVWYEECISARFIRPDGEAARAALKNADWDPLTPKGTKVKKVSAGPPRPSTAAVVAPGATVPPSAGAAVAALTTAPDLTAAPAPMAAPVVGPRKTLAHRTVPSSPSARSAAAAALGRKRSREASSVGAAPVEAAPARVTAVEMAAVERPRKRTLFTSPEGGNEEGVPSEIVREAPPVAVSISPLPPFPFYLDDLYAKLHEEGGSSASAPLDEDSMTIIERLREFLLLGVREMTATGALMEFRSCLDTAMAIGLLDSAQLDELQARLAEGEEMIGRYAEAVTRMAEGSLLEQDLVGIKEKVEPAMARLKENDLVVQRENEELAQVEAQIAELQTRRALILQRRDGAVAAGRELKSSAKQILKAATETKKALAERKLIRARWQTDIDGDDIAWRRITCLVWGMFSEGA